MDVDASADLPNGVQDNGRLATHGKTTSLADGDTGVNSVRGDLAAPSAQPLPSWHSCRKMIYVRPNPKSGVPTGHWPIPESFWPESSMVSLVSAVNTIKEASLLVLWTAVSRMSSC